MRISENCSIIQVPSVDINGSGIASNYINMEEGKDLTIMINAGVMGAASAVTLQQATDNAGTGAKALTYTGSYSTTYSATVASQVDVPVFASGALTIAATGDNKCYLIELDASELDVSNGFSHVKLVAADPAVASVVGATLVLTKKRSVDASAK
jgi:hypothetical protein